MMKLGKSVSASVSESHSEKFRLVLLFEFFSVILILIRPIPTAKIYRELIKEFKPILQPQIQLMKSVLRQNMYSKQ